jgi:hypothetical protein
MLLMVTYQTITASSASPYWDIISHVLLTIVVCGDSIILLVYDRRWKASVRELMLRIQSFWHELKIF